MKQLFPATNVFKGLQLPFQSLTLLLIIFLASCTKEGVQRPDVADLTAAKSTNQPNILGNYTGLSFQTMWELQQARAASAKYQNIDNAIKDGYVDINVVAQNMGYHFLKAASVDGTFNYREPEILVYNKDDNDKFYLVAVEYAVPLNLPMPSGFTGNADVWNGHTGFGLWLLHAWVWAYNPDGVFNPTNPSVHLH